MNSKIRTKGGPFFMDTRVLYRQSLQINYQQRANFDKCQIEEESFVQTQQKLQIIIETAEKIQSILIIPPNTQFQDDQMEIEKNTIQIANNSLQTAIQQPKENQNFDEVKDQLMNISSNLSNIEQQLKVNQYSFQQQISDKQLKQNEIQQSQMEEKLMVYIKNAIGNIMNDPKTNNSAKDDQLDLMKSQIIPVVENLCSKQFDPIIQTLKNSVSALQLNLGGKTQSFYENKEVKELQKTIKDVQLKNQEVQQALQILQSITQKEQQDMNKIKQQMDQQMKESNLYMQQNTEKLSQAIQKISEASDQVVAEKIQLLKSQVISKNEIENQLQEQKNQFQQQIATSGSQQNEQDQQNIKTIQEELNNTQSQIVSFQQEINQLNQSQLDQQNAAQKLQQQNINQQLEYQNQLEEMKKQYSSVVQQNQQIQSQMKSQVINQEDILKATFQMDTPDQKTFYQHDLFAIFNNNLKRQIELNREIASKNQSGDAETSKIINNLTNEIQEMVVSTIVPVIKEFQQSMIQEQNNYKQELNKSLSSFSQFSGVSQINRDLSQNQQETNKLIQQKDILEKIEEKMNKSFQKIKLKKNRLSLSIIEKNKILDDKQLQLTKLQEELLKNLPEQAKQSIIKSIEDKVKEKIDEFNSLSKSSIELFEQNKKSDSYFYIQEAIKQQNLQLMSQSLLSDTTLKESLIQELSSKATDEQKKQLYEIQSLKNQQKIIQEQIREKINEQQTSLEKNLSLKFEEQKKFIQDWISSKEEELASMDIESSVKQQVQNQLQLKKKEIEKSNNLTQLDKATKNQILSLGDSIQSVQQQLDNSLQKNIQLQQKFNELSEKYSLLSEEQKQQREDQQKDFIKNQTEQSKLVMNLKNASELITKQELSISQLKITSDNSLKIAGTCEQGLERLKQEFKDDLKTSQSQQASLSQKDKYSAVQQVKNLLDQEVSQINQKFGILSNNYDSQAMKNFAQSVSNFMQSDKIEGGWFSVVNAYIKQLQNDMATIRALVIDQTKEITEEIQKKQKQQTEEMNKSFQVFKDEIIKQLSTQDASFVEKIKGIVAINDAIEKRQVVLEQGFQTLTKEQESQKKDIQNLKTNIQGYAYQADVELMKTEQIQLKQSIQNLEKDYLKTQDLDTLLKKSQIIVGLDEKIQSLNSQMIKVQSNFTDIQWIKDNPAMTEYLSGQIKKLSKIKEDDALYINMSAIITQTLNQVKVIQDLQISEYKSWFDLISEFLQILQQNEIKYVKFLGSEYQVIDLVAYWKWKIFTDRTGQIKTSINFNSQEIKLSDLSLIYNKLYIQLSLDVFGGLIKRNQETKDLIEPINQKCEGISDSVSQMSIQYQQQNSYMMCLFNQCDTNFKKITKDQSDANTNAKQFQQYALQKLGDQNQQLQSQAVVLNQNIAKTLNLEIQLKEQQQNVQKLKQYQEEQQNHIKQICVDVIQEFNKFQSWVSNCSLQQKQILNVVDQIPLSQQEFSKQQNIQLDAVVQQLNDKLKEQQMQLKQQQKTSTTIDSKKTDIIEQIQSIIVKDQINKIYNKNVEFINTYINALNDLPRVVAYDQTPNQSYIQNMFYSGDIPINTQNIFSLRLMHLQSISASAAIRLPISFFPKKQDQMETENAKLQENEYYIQQWLHSRAGIIPAYYPEIEFVQPVYKEKQDAKKQYIQGNGFYQQPIQKISQIQEEALKNGKNVINYSKNKISSLTRSQIQQILNEQQQISDQIRIIQNKDPTQQEIQNNGQIKITELSDELSAIYQQSSDITSQENNSILDIFSKIGIQVDQSSFYDWMKQQYQEIQWNQFKKETENRNTIESYIQKDQQTKNLDEEYKNQKKLLSQNIIQNNPTIYQYAKKQQISLNQSIQTQQQDNQILQQVVDNQDQIMNVTQESYLTVLDLQQTVDKTTDIFKQVKTDIQDLAPIYLQYQSSQISNLYSEQYLKQSDIVQINKNQQQIDSLLDKFPVIKQQSSYEILTTKFAGETIRNHINKRYENRQKSYQEFVKQSQICLGLITQISIEILSPQRNLMEKMFGYDNDSSVGPLEFFNNEIMDQIKQMASSEYIYNYVYMTKLLNTLCVSMFKFRFTQNLEQQTGESQLNYSVFIQLTKSQVFTQKLLNLFDQFRNVYEKNFQNQNGLLNLVIPPINWIWQQIKAISVSACTEILDFVQQFQQTGIFDIVSIGSDAISNKQSNLIKNINNLQEFLSRSLSDAEQNIQFSLFIAYMQCEPLSIFIDIIQVLQILMNYNNSTMDFVSVYNQVVLCYQSWYDYEFQTRLDNLQFLFDSNKSLLINLHSEFLQIPMIDTKQLNKIRDYLQQEEQQYYASDWNDEYYYFDPFQKQLSQKIKICYNILGNKYQMQQQQLIKDSWIDMLLPQLQAFAKYPYHSSLNYQDQLKNNVFPTFLKSIDQIWKYSRSFGAQFLYQTYKMQLQNQNNNNNFEAFWNSANSNERVINFEFTGALLVEQFHIIMNCIYSVLLQSSTADGLNFLQFQSMIAEFFKSLEFDKLIEHNQILGYIKNNNMIQYKRSIQYLAQICLQIIGKNSQADQNLFYQQMYNMSMTLDNDLGSIDSNLLVTVLRSVNFGTYLNFLPLQSAIQQSKRILLSNSLEQNQCEYIISYFQSTLNIIRMTYLLKNIVI